MDKQMIEFYLEKVRTDSHFKEAYGITVTSARYLNNGHENATRYKISNDELTMIPAVIYIKKTFFLLDAMNVKLGLIQAAGLLKYWRYINDGDSRKTIGKVPKVLSL